MTDKLTVRAVHWNAPGASLVTAYAVSRVAQCKTAEDYDHAREVYKATRARRAELLPLFTKANGINAIDKADEFDAAVTALDDEVTEVVLAPAAFRWIREKLNEQIFSGAWADSRDRLFKSLKEAVERDDEIKTG